MTTLKFQTVVEIPKFSRKTGYSKKNMFIGSCFTENVGSKMAALKYNVDINPLGILYNPISVANGLKLLLDEEEFEKESLIFHDGLWHSFYHHGRFSSPDVNLTLHKINHRLNYSSLFLKEADFLFLTFGTAWIYEFKATGQIVSNCHKIPSGKFKRFRLSVGEIVEMYRGILPEIWKVNPNLKVIFTVSPIRHWKDGAIENQRSKSTLLLAIDRIIGGFGTKCCSYFPAYEIVMDELRDYRFYASDMIHLSEVAVDHIWAIFRNALIDTESQKTDREVQKINNAINHKPFNRETVNYQRFLEKTLENLIELTGKFPNLNFKLEKEYLKTNLSNFK